MRYEPLRGIKYTLKRSEYVMLIEDASSIKGNELLYTV